MFISQAGLNTLFVSFNTTFNEGVGMAVSHWKEVAMEVPSSTGTEVYAWLSAIPQMREWIGERVIKDLAIKGYAIANRRFENTISLPRISIEGDQYGVFAPVLKQMGMDAARHPDELIFGLLAAGFSNKCYDGQNFFDVDHLVGDGVAVPKTTVANMQDGPGPAWYLLDCSQPIRPLIFQSRMPYDFTALTQPNDPNVFFRDEYVYGVRARCNAGFGLWQLAYGSKTPRTTDTYAAARAAMQSQISDTGRPLGVNPTHLVVPPSLDRDARRLLVSALTAQTVNSTVNGVVTPETVAVTNEWAGSATRIMSQYLLTPSV